MTRSTRYPPLQPLLLVLLAVSCAARPGGPPPSPRSTDQWDNDWARGAVVYEIFVRSFHDADGDGIGDLRGLAAKLDYLNDGNPQTTTDLSVDAVWLMPIFDSPSYHGYDTVDYGRIEPDYGTDADFDRLIREAHRRGIRVVLDFVPNHCSSRHPWFLAAASPSSEYRQWFVWRDANPGWTRPWGGTNAAWHQGGEGFYYGVFSNRMPDWNLRHPGVRRALEGYAVRWLERGADGLRLDATRYLVENGPGRQQEDQPETHQLLKELAARVRRVKPQALLVGENWTDTATIGTYYGSTATIAGGDELPMNFNFPLSGAILRAVKSGDPAPVAATLAEMKTAYPAGSMDAPFLTNHDMVRLATQLGGDPARLRLAASILLTLPGTPFLYYGEEVGLQNGPANTDEAKRTPMPWDSSSGGGFTAASPWFPFAPGRDAANVAAQSGDPASLLSHYRDLVRLRRESRAVRRGAIEILDAGASAGSVLAFVRRDGADRVLVLHNLGGAAATVGPLAMPALGGPGLLPRAGGGTPRGAPGAWTIVMPPASSGAWRISE